MNLNSLDKSENNLKQAPSASTARASAFETETKSVFSMQQNALSSNSITEKDLNKKSIINIDGKIDNYEQSLVPKVSDCWLLSGLSALSATKNGQTAIKNSISQDKDGNVTVELKGIKQSYKFKQEEIKEAESRLSTGDDDVRAIELAVEQFRLNLLKNGDGVKTATVFDQKYDKRIGNAEMNFPLKGGSADQLFYLMTGKESEYREDFILSKIFASKVDSHLINIENNPEKFANIAFFKTDGDSLRKNHSYAISSVDKDSVTLINPTDSAKKIKLSRSEFLESNPVIISCDLEDK